MTNTAQSWALLGILGTMATGLLALVAVAQANLKAFVSARFDAVDVRFTAVDQRLDGVDRRLDGVERRLEALDRDVQVLFRDRP
jgi:hypothetical protein